VPVTKHGVQTSGTQRPQINTHYTPLVGPEAWLSTMGNRRMSFASTFVFYPLPNMQIRTSASYRRPHMGGKTKMGLLSVQSLV